MGWQGQCNNNIEYYWIHNIGNFVIAERYIRTTRSNIYNHMTVVSKNNYIDQLDEIVNKQINTYYKKIKIKPADVNSDTYVQYNVDYSNQNPKFKVDDRVRILKYKKYFGKGIHSKLF